MSQQTLEELIDRPVHVAHEQFPWGTGGAEFIMTREGAFELLTRAKGKTPADWISWMHLGSALHIAGDSEGGLTAARKAMELYPCSSTLMNVAIILEAFGRFDESLELTAMAIQMDPTDQFAGLLWAQGHLRNGNWAEAWVPFEHYCWGKIWEVGLEQYIPQWYGEPLKGKRILIMQGGGFGDNLMFMRWFRNLKEMGAHVTYACPDVMVPLLEGHPWIDCLLPTHEGPETGELPELDLWVEKDGVKQYDYFVPLMGLPRRLGITLENLRSESYITAKDTIVPPPHKKPFVGICWMGAEKLDPRRHRSLTFDQAKRLLQVDTVNWVSLQQNMTPPIDIPCPVLKNWSQTADIIAGLDLIVTVDTGVMHLAGAMGKPTWVMLPGLSDWKFLRDSEKMPFYPSVRLFRNQGIGLDNALEQCIKTLQKGNL